MSTENEDKWLDELLNQLPKNEPVSEFQHRKYERKIDELAAELAASRGTPSRSKNYFRVSMGIAAAIVVLVVGFSLTSGGSNLNVEVPVAIDSPSPSTSTDASPTPSETPNSEENPSPAPSTSPTKRPTPRPSSTVPEQTVSQGSDGSKVAVREYSTNLDYDQDLRAIKAKISLRKTPGSLRGLSNAKQTCATKLGLVAQLVAIDNALYQGRPITAYFIVDSAGTISALIADVSCEEITTIDWAM